VLIGFRQDANGLAKEYAFFCENIARDFGVEVYRKSAGGSAWWKSSGKYLTVVLSIRF
jgi:hypothetical protein